MEIFLASRLTEGNRLFPSKILIDNIGVTIQIPGLFGNKEKTIPFSRISSVDVDCPLLGFSRIIIQTTGEGSISANGFKKIEVKRMKELILDNI